MGDSGKPSLVRGTAWGGKPDKPLIKVRVCLSTGQVQINSKARIPSTASPRPTENDIIQIGIQRVVRIQKEAQRGIDSPKGTLINMAKWNLMKKKKDLGK